MPDESWKYGFVQYQRAKEKIPIVFAGSEELERHEGRPSYIKYTWREMYGGKVTGTYVLCIQGAMVYDSWYIRSRDKKKIKLERIIKEDDCADCFKPIIKEDATQE